VFSLLPKEDVYFELFDKAAANAVSCAQELLVFFERYDDLDVRRRRIKELEHVGDEITHSILEHLNQTFITPLDREDIHELASRLDDIVDRIDTAVDRVCLFKIEKPTDEAKQFARCLVRSTQLIQEMLPLLRKRRSAEEVRMRVREVHRLENEADAIERTALALLFENATDPIRVIKWKNVIEVLESATDRCEDVANVIEGILLKNA
jgi:predicted phosphate transport protein (TIGR00153 family)